MESIEVMVSTGAFNLFETTSDILAVLDRNSTVANGTLTFPGDPRPKQSLYVYSKSQVTNVTISSVKTVYNPITTAAAGFRGHWIYVPEANSGNGAWVPMH